MEADASVQCRDNLAFIDDQPTLSSDAAIKGKTSATSREQDRAQDGQDAQSVSLHQLFRFASQFDVVLIAVSALAAISSGVCMPLSIIFFGDLTNVFVGNDAINDIRCNNTTAATDWLTKK